MPQIQADSTAQATNQYSLWYLFSVTTCIACGAWLVSFGPSELFLCIAGVGVLLYWASRGLTAVANRCDAKVAWAFHLLSVFAIGFSAAATILGFGFYLVQLIMRN